MRIAFTHAFCWPEVRRGAERFTQELGAALVERGHEVTILSAGWDPTTDELDGVRTVRLQRHREAPIGHEADFGRRVLPSLVRGRYDAVHSMGRRDALASIRAARIHRRRRTVITDLGLPSRAFWADLGREARVVAAVVRGIDVYSCMSQYALDYLVRDYGRHDGVVVPGGVDLRTFVPGRRADTPTILYSGALDEPRKGLATLLASIPAVAQVHPRLRVWLSGPGDPTPFLDAATRDTAARTEVLGTGDARSQHHRYAEAWVTTLPSVADSFGMALIESLACGTPIVVTTDGAPKELVEPGATGELCPPNAPEALAEALLRGLDLANAPATAERCRASVERFDWRAGLAPLVERLYSPT